MQKKQQQVFCFTRPRLWIINAKSNTWLSPTPTSVFLNNKITAFSSWPIRQELGAGLSHEILFTGSKTTRNRAIIGSDYRSAPIRCKFYWLCDLVIAFLLESVPGWKKPSARVKVCIITSKAKSGAHIKLFDLEMYNSSHERIRFG